VKKSHYVGNSKGLNRIPIYLAGPIQGIEDAQQYREIIKKFLKKRGFSVYDPWEDEAIFYKDFDYDVACYLSQKDKTKVQESDILIAYFSHCSIGTTREVEWALQANKRIIIICPMENPSPHLVSMSKEFFTSIKDFMKYFTK